MYWNIRGLRRTQAKDKLRSLVSNFSPSLLWVAEPKVRVTNSILRQIKLPVIFNTRQAITVQIGDVLVTGIHAACLTIDRRALWEELMEVSELNFPWLVIGDLNVKWNWEVFGDLRIKVKTTEEKVLAAFLESDVDPENIELLNKLVTARGEHELASQQYNELMRVNSRVQRVKEVSHYKKKFERKNVEFDEDLFEAIPKILTGEDNIFLDVVPSHVKIKNSGFGINANSAPGPDGFPESFCKFAWEVIDRIGTLTGKMISEQQGAFIKGINIHDKIVLASELVNELEIKRRGGNVGLKIDITQAYDSLRWDFLFEVMRKFGISEIGIRWLMKIFELARILVLVNGGPCGFFLKWRED
ncbi:uncharacterized protein LOC113352217 [Papaver somniferum]|uniref:uncharacterized protein LOC113352217 n=1 Tax=Papaver somniferum TaxID=3469 RepID=UPI000E6FBDF7|nr:uncharacterized protein LOC113352217 [Papaver somniferum]